MSAFDYEYKFLSGISQVIDRLVNELAMNGWEVFTAQVSGDSGRYWSVVMRRERSIENE